MARKKKILKETQVEETPPALSIEMVNRDTEQFFSPFMVQFILKFDV